MYMGIPSHTFPQGKRAGRLMFVKLIRWTWLIFRYYKIVNYKIDQPKHTQEVQEARAKITKTRRRQNRGTNARIY